MIRTMNSTGQRIAIYSRVSTDEQAKEGFGLDVQERRMLAYCEAKGYEVAEVIRDEGYSAKTLARPGMERIYELVGFGLADKNGKRAVLRAPDIDGVLVLKLDRLTRSVIDFGRLLEDFKEAGISFEAVDGDINTSTAGGRMLTNVMVSVSQWEREVIAERTKAALSEAKAKGVHLGKPPVGWRVERGKLVPGDRIGIVIQAHELRGQGLTLQGIADRMNELGVPTATGRGEWRKNTVVRVLNAPLPPVQV